MLRPSREPRAKAGRIPHSTVECRFTQPAFCTGPNQALSPDAVIEGFQHTELHGRGSIGDYTGGKLWLWDEKRSLLARHANYEANDMHKQPIYRNAIVKLDAQRNDIKAQANGTVIDAPKLGSGQT